MLESQYELLANGSGDICVRLLNTLIIHYLRRVVRIYRRNNQLHICANIP